LYFIALSYSALFFTIPATDPNEWAEMHHSGVMIAFSIIIGGYSFAVAALAMYKLAVSYH
jgi:hypothetical protein